MVMNFGGYGPMAAMNRQRPTRAPVNPDPRGTVAAGGVDERAGAFDALSTSDKLKRYTGEGQDAINQSLQAAISAAMPEFNQGLQGIRESAIRRGVTLGDVDNIQTQNEGSLASAFQKNIANTAGSMAQQNYQTGLDRLYGYRDMQTAKSNAQDARRSGFWSTLGGIGGAALGGPFGAALGKKVFG